MAEGKPDLGQVEHATVALLVKWTLNGYQRTLKGYQCMAMARDSVLLAIWLLFVTPSCVLFECRFDL